MTGGEDWLFRPILEAQMYTYESLTDGTLDLADVAACNEALDVRNENRARVEEAMRERNRS